MSWAASVLVLRSVRLFFWRFGFVLLIPASLIFAAERTEPGKTHKYAAWLDKASPRTLGLLEDLPPDSAIAFWVLFSDKGIETDAQYKAVLDSSARRLSERSMKRRMQRGKRPWTDFTDLQVNTAYVSELRNLGVTIRVVSDWLNAASVLAVKQQIEAAARLPFVGEVRPVARFIRREPKIDLRQLERLSKPQKEGVPGYGESYAQLAQIHVPDFHRIGITGKGVLITLLDSGFFLGHPCFAHVLDSGRLLATRDFINGDDDVEDEDDGQRDHGTSVWSLVGGFYEGSLIGAAYGAEFALAKTEREDVEIQIEEDHWVAAVEWAEALGTDIVSTSLGYNLWYTYQDMDGNTALCTRAADLAVSKGVVVVNAAGNERVFPWYYIIAPADGDSVIAVGAVDPDGIVTNFSSAGPTYDGRTKPDVMALGEEDFCATRDGGYGYNQGTSFATPLVAGACALLLEVNPTWDPITLRQALWTTASQAADPDNLMGYGIVNAAKASGFSYLELTPSEFAFEASFGDIDSLRSTLEIVDWQGENLEWTASPQADWISVFPASGLTPDLIWVTVNPSGQRVGVNQGYLEISAEAAINAEVILPVVLTLHPTVEMVVFPNPFTDSLTVLVEESELPRRIRIDVFTVAGELVYTFPEQDGPELYQRTWDGKNKSGEEVAGGVYLLRVDINGDSEIRKVAKVK